MLVTSNDRLLRETKDHLVSKKGNGPPSTKCVSRTR